MIYFLIEDKPCLYFKNKKKKGYLRPCRKGSCLHAEKNKDILNFEPCIFLGDEGWKHDHVLSLSLGQEFIRRSRYGLIPRSSAPAESTGIVYDEG